MIRAVTHAVDDTRRLAAALAEQAQAGDVVLLSGDLGAGKTAFVQGFAAAMGVDEPVTSPTFTLANEYHGRLDVHHLDAYRLEDLGEVIDLGLFELLDDGSVVLIEWGDAVSAVLPNDFLRIVIELGPGDDDRVIRLEPVGTRWTARANRLASALAPWCGGAGEARGEEASC